MIEVDPNVLDVAVVTRRQGALSAVGHDLLLRAQEPTVRLARDPWRLEVDIDPRRVRVASTLGPDDSAGPSLSARDREKIDGIIHDTVLRAATSDPIAFRSTAITPIGDGFRVVGTLRIRDAVREIGFSAREHDGALMARVPLVQSDFGITPYRAMMGALKVRDEVELRVRLTWPLPA